MPSVILETAIWWQASKMVRVAGDTCSIPDAFDCFSCSLPVHGSLPTVYPCIIADSFLLKTWALTAELRQRMEIAQTYSAHLGAVPPLELAEHLASVIQEDLSFSGLVLLGATSHTPAVLLHELLLARGIGSKLVKGYTIVKGRSGLSCMPNVWVEACGQEFDMLARISIDLHEFINSPRPKGQPHGQHSTLRVEARPPGVPLLTDLEPSPALEKMFREVHHMWEAMDRADSDEERIEHFWFYSGGSL
jgi:hypothetical protein